MKKSFLSLLTAVLVFASAKPSCASVRDDETQVRWKAQWISSGATREKPNTWLNYRKTVDLPSLPTSVKAKIGADSKYWLWINGRLVVFEGGLKRGPNPNDTYYDEVELAPYLVKGKNTIAVLLWYFGRPSFAHNDSGKAGLIFDCQTSDFDILSDDTWKCEANAAYGTCPPPMPNMRLAESNILYDGRKKNDAWHTPGYDDSDMPQAVENGPAGSQPWNKLVKRPVPLWRIGELRDYESCTRSGDSLICKLPYNGHFTPYIRLKTSSAGDTVKIMTDNYLVYNGGDNYLRCEYITKEGLQEYENKGWFNGHKMYYILPEGAEVEAVKFRETGYDTEFTGTFECSDPLYNKFWGKALRTLYVTMRDTYMDCPDRERSQWTGDAVNESGEAFYVLSESAALLTRKWLHDLAGWQKPDGVIYAPVPSSNWDKELPGQVMASLGYYGLWNYYLYTGDKQTLEDLYPAVQRYIALWKKGDKGTMLLREGGWNWGDWGTDIDIVPLQNCWYYMMIKGMYNTALTLNKKEDAKKYADEMAALKQAFNNHFWTGTEYRDPQYENKTDDRIHALAVVSGLADEDKYEAIRNVLLTEEHASPYMEKYVFEAFVQMGYGTEGLARHNRRFARMVEDDRFTTLFEGWGIGSEGFGGGSVNHAWSGGGLTIAAQYICGIRPLEAAYRTVGILPNPSGLSHAKATTLTPVGAVESSFEQSPNVFSLNVLMPLEAKGVIGAPKAGVREVKIDGSTVWKDGRPVKNKVAKFCKTQPDALHLAFDIKGGAHKLIAVQ